MSRNWTKSITLVSTALALVLAASAVASAGPTTTLTFPDGTNFFKADVSTTSALATVSLVGTVTLQSGPVLGTPISASANINVPAQNHVVNVFIANVNSTPTGTAQLTGGPGVNNLQFASLQDINVILLASHALSLSTIPVSGTATIDILGIASVDFDLSAKINTSGAIQNVGVNGVTYGPALGMNGLAMGTDVPPAGGRPGAPDSTFYPLVVPPGDLSAGISADVFVNDFTVDLGIFGTVTQDLGSVANISTSISTLLGLPGNVLLEDYAYPAVQPAPLRFTMTDGGFLAGQDLSLDLELPTQVQNLVQDFDVTIDLGIFGTVTLDGHFSGVATFGFTGGQAALTNLTYQLQDHVPNFVIPEPSSIYLGALGLVALVPILRRRRKA